MNEQLCGPAIRVPNFTHNAVLISTKRQMCLQVQLSCLLWLFLSRELRHWTTEALDHWTTKNHRMGRRNKRGRTL